MLTEVRLLDKWGTHIKNLDYLERKKKSLDLNEKWLDVSNSEIFPNMNMEFLNMS